MGGSGAWKCEFWGSEVEAGRRVGKEDPTGIKMERDGVGFG